MDEAVEHRASSAGQNTFEQLARRGPSGEMTHGYVEALSLAVAAAVKARKVQLNSGAEKVDTEVDVAAVAGRAHDGELQMIVLRQRGTLRNLVYACYVNPVHRILS